MVYTHNPDRQLELVTRDDGATIATTYDAGGRVASVALARGVTTYGYDAVTGSLASIAAPDVG